MKPKGKTRALFWLLAIVGLATAQTTDFASRVNNYCANTNISALLPTSDADRSAQIAGFRNPYAISLQSLLNMTSGGFNAGNISGVSVFAIVMTIFMIVVAVVSLVLFVLFLQICDTCTTKSELIRKVMCFAAFGAVGVVGFLGLTLYVLSGRALSHLNEIACAVSLTPDAVVNGRQSDGISFVGLNSLSTTFLALGAELTKLNFIAPQLLNSNKTTWVSDASSMMSSLSVFATTNSKLKIPDGNGGQDVPTSLKQINSNITDAIGTEFDFLSQALRALNDSVAVSAYFTAIGAQKVGAAVNITAANVQQITSTVSSSFDSILNVFDFFLSSGRKGSIVTIVMISLLVGVLALLTILLFFFVCTARCHERRSFAKLLLILSGIFGLLLTIFNLFVFINAFASGTVCAGVDTLMNMNSFDNFTKAYNLSVGSVSASTGINSVVQMIDTCVMAGGSGYLGGLFESGNSTNSIYGNLVSMINGYKFYSQNKAKFDSSLNQSATVSNFSLSFDPLRNGLMYDFDVTSTALGAFNTMVSCSGVTYGFNATTCVSGCTMINSTSVYNHNNCAGNKTTAQTAYTNLQSYITKEIQMIDKLRIDLGLSPVSTTFTPARLYTTSFNDITNNKATLDLSLIALNKTVASVSNVDVTYQTATNCKVFRTQVQILQGAYCLDNNQNNAAFFIVLMISVTLLLLFNCLVYFSLRCMKDQSGVEEEREDSPAKGNQIMQEKDLAKSKSP